ncbi:MAG: PrsW family glutamic-type intramembrane protease, partial [Acetivibrio ethanolgignens]
MKRFFIEKKHIILVTITLVFFFAGVSSQFIDLTKNNGHDDKYPIFLLAISMIGFYLIPMALGIYYLKKRWEVSDKPLVISWILGLSATGFLSTIFHMAIGFFWLNIIQAPQEFLNAWGGSVSAPFAEELAKYLVVLLVLYFAHEKSLKATWLSAIIVGLGFQIIEDISYTSVAVFQENTSGFSSLFERIAYSFGTHWVFTGLFAFGMLVLTRKKLLIPKWKGCIWAISSIALHFLWNSPIEFDGFDTIL